MPKVTVKVKELHYAHKAYRYGQTIDMPEKDARVLKIIGKVQDGEVKLRASDPRPARPAAPRVPEQASFTAEGDSIETSRRRPRRSYLRSDMRAEDE